MRQWLRQIRVAKGFTQVYMAAELGMNQNTYSRLELGEYQPELRLPLICKLAKVLNLTLEDIRRYEEAKEV